MQSLGTVKVMSFPSSLLCSEFMCGTSTPVVGVFSPTATWRFSSHCPETCRSGELETENCLLAWMWLIVCISVSARALWLTGDLPSVHTVSHTISSGRASSSGRMCVPALCHTQKHNSQIAEGMDAIAPKRNKIVAWWCQPSSVSQKWKGLPVRPEHTQTHILRSNTGCFYKCVESFPGPVPLGIIITCKCFALVTQCIL